MTLTSHAVVGATVASLFPLHPVLAVFAAFTSHFIIDAIPHWDYPIASRSINPHIGAPMKYDRAFLTDVLRIGSDIFLGLLFSYLVFSQSNGLFVILLGACAGMLPDPLQFVYAHFKHEPLISLQRFHRWIHTNNHLENAKLFGVFSQILFLLMVVYVAKFII